MKQSGEGLGLLRDLLGQSVPESLQLDEFDDDFYADDHDSPPIEDLIPDYSILDQIDYKYPVIDAYFGYASRGCVRKCHFFVVCRNLKAPKRCQIVN